MPSARTHLTVLAFLALLFLGASGQGLAADERFDRHGTEWGLRWFPTHVHFGPDNDTLLVGLGHLERIGAQANRPTGGARRTLRGG